MATAHKRGGRRPGSGRKKGVPNKLNASIKKAIEEAFENVGGVAYLVMVAKSDPKTFCALLGRVIPQQLGSDPENPLPDKIEIRVIDAPPAESREEWLARRKREIDAESQRSQPCSTERFARCHRS